MDTDLFLVVGIVIAVFSFPSVISSFSSGRPPRAAAIAAIIGGGLIAIAVTQKPGGYNFREVPDVFSHVVSKYLG